MLAHHGAPSLCEWGFASESSELSIDCHIASVNRVGPSNCVPSQFQKTDFPAQIATGNENHTADFRV